MDKIASNLILGFYCEECKVEVVTLKSFTKNKDALILQFSVRKSGLYSIICKYGCFQFASSHVTFEVLPGPICLENTTLETANPEIITITENLWTVIKVLSHDRYGNICQMDAETANKFQLNVKQVSKLKIS